MRHYILSLITIALIGAFAQGADRRQELFASWQQVSDRREELFASWQKAQREVQSLAIEFTLETKENVFDQRQTAQGMFRLVRTPKGELFASYEVTDEKTKGEKQERDSLLLHRGSVYMLRHDRKVALRLAQEGRDLRALAEKYWNPFVLLLDRKQAEEKCKLEIIKRDEWYTCLAVKPKQGKRTGWLPDNFLEGRVVLMNTASDRIPKDMPRQLWHTSGGREYTFTIRSWRLNAADGPKVEEFVRPHDLPGWKVIE